MLKVSKGFEEARNKRFAEKEPEYGGKDNSKNWRNLRSETLIRLILGDAKKLDEHIYKLEIFNNSRRKPYCKQLCIDIANRCELLWRKLK